MDNSNLISKKQLKDNYEKYNGYFSDIIQAIVSKLQSSIKLMAQPTYKSRVKGFESYYRKVLRLKSSQIKENKSFIYLTDMMGIRMICAFLEDINLAVEQIKRIFEVKEVEVKGAEKKFSEFGYESIHVLISVPAEYKEAIKDKYKDLEPVTDELVCEIQIRTILQDAWAEVEHELIYKTEFNPFDIPLRRKLASINASLTLADITFQEIRDYQNKLQKELDERRKSFYSKADDLLNERKPEINVLKTDIKRISPFVQGTIDDMILKAIECHNQGRLEEAVDIYTEILKALTEKDKTIISVIRKHRGMAYFSMNNFDAALEDFSKSIDADPKSYRSYYYKGIVLSIKKEYEQAIDCFTQSLDLNEFQAHASFRRAMAYYEVQEYEKAINDLGVALKLGMNPDDCKPLQEKLSKKFGMSM